MNSEIFCFNFPVVFMAAVKNIGVCQRFSNCKPTYLAGKKRPTGKLFSCPLAKSVLNTIS